MRCATEIRKRLFYYCIVQMIKKMFIVNLHLTTQTQKQLIKNKY